MSEEKVESTDQSCKHGRAKRSSRCGRAKRMVFFVALAAMLGLAYNAYAGWFSKTPEERAQKFVEHVADELELNEAQTTQLNGIAQEVLEKTKDHRAKRGEHYDLVINQVKSGQIDKALLKEELGKKKDQFSSVAELVIDRLADFYQTLSPEQRTILVERLEEFKERASKGHRGHGWWH